MAFSEKFRLSGGGFRQAEGRINSKPVTQIGLTPKYKMEDYFAVRLKELRERAGLTQKGLASKMRMARSTMTRLESGSLKPSWGTLLALCEVFSVACTAFTHK